MTTDFNFKNVPEIRFKGFNGKWENKKFGNIIKVIMGQSPNSSNYTNNSKDHILVQGNSDIVNGKVCPRVWTTQVTKEAKPGDILLSVRAPVGDVSKTEYNVVIGRGVAAIKGNEFIYQLLKLSKIRKYWNRFITGSTFESINSIDIKNADFFMTNSPEQEKIGSLFFKLDTLIATSKQKTKKLKMLKRALLQKMFASEKQRFPEIRFKGFNNEWEKKKFEEIYNKVSEKNDLTFKGNKIISVANMYFKNTNNDSDDKYMRTYNVFRVGDIAFEGNKSKYFKYGRFVENTIGNGIVSHVFDVLRPKSDYNLYYWKYFINNDNIMGRILRKCTTKATMMNNLTSSAFLKQTILVPSLPEQEKIGSLFFKLDALITTSEQKSAKLEELKKALLQKMFI